MIFAGAKPIKIPRYGSKCLWDDPTQLPLGLAQIARNVRYTAQSVATRYGHSTRIKISEGDAITAVGLLRYLAAQPGTLNLSAVETVLLMAYDATGGNIYTVAPFIQNTLTNLTTGAFFAATGYTQAQYKSLNPVFTQGFNKGFVAMGDLLLPQQQPLVYVPILSSLYPCSDLPFGAPWTPGTSYRVGQVVSPSQFQTFGQPGGQGTWVEQQTGFLFQCIQAGTSGNAASQPAWPMTFDATVNDNTVVWKECTPIFLSGLPDPPAPTLGAVTPDAGSPIVPGARVYAACTFVNPVGEGVNSIINTQGFVDSTKVLLYTNNTGGNVDVAIILPNIPSFLAPTGPLGGAFGATGLNLYVFIDTNPVNSTSDPSQIVDPSFYALVNTGAPVAGGTTITVNAYPTGKQIPQTSTAATTSIVGNVDTGIRYMTMMFQMQSGYITGFSNSAPVKVSVTQSGWPITVLRLPIGTYQCGARIVGSTVAGASAAGPYTYVSQADIESPGFNQPSVEITATLVPDNVTQQTSFNFTDTYLPGASDVTNYFTRIQIPPVVDVYFAKSLQRMVYTGAVGYQSGHLLSDVGDPEAVRVPAGVLQVSESDGDRTVCFREIRGLAYSFKENGIFAPENNGSDPSTWNPRKIEAENGVGPVSAAAIDIASQDGQEATEFAVFAHRSGLYLFTTNASLINRELASGLNADGSPTDWETINWEVGHLVKVKIDPVRRQIYVMAPTNGATTCNTRWTLNYFFGMGDPVVFVPRRGILVPNVEGRKWSQDDVAFNDAVYIPQKSRNAVQLAGLDVAKEMCFAASDGSLKTITENQYFDEDYNGNQVGYFSAWVGVLGDLGQPGFSKCIGASMFATGNGLCNVAAYDDNNTKFPITGPLSPFLLTPGRRTRADLPMMDVPGLSQRWAVGFDNGGVAGAWWQMIVSTLFHIPMWESTPG